MPKRREKYHYTRVYNYDKFRRMGVKPIPVNKLKAIRNFVPEEEGKTYSDKLEERYPGWDVPKPRESELAPPKPFNEDIEFIRQPLYFKSDPKKHHMYNLVKLRNLTDQSMIYQITPSNFRLVVKPWFGILAPLQAVILEITADYRKYINSMPAFFQQKIVIETVTTEKHFRMRKFMVTHWQNNQDRVKTMVLDKFLLYRKPAHGAFDKYQLCNLIEEYDPMAEEKRRQRKRKREAAKLRKSNETALLIATTAAALITEVPDPAFPIPKLKVLFVLAGALNALLGTWIFCYNPTCY